MRKCTHRIARIRATVIVTAVLIGSLLMLTHSAVAQGPVGRELEDKTIDAKVQKEIIDSVMMAYNEVYIFPEVARKMEKYVGDQYKNNKYEELTSTRDFVQKLAEDMREISKDRHINVGYLSDEDLAMMTRDTLTDDERVLMLRSRQRSNYGWKDVKILPGNVGYVDLRGFSDTEEAGFTAIAAMNFLAYTDAIIFDLRQNGGGSPSMIQLISSYLFEERKHLNSFYIRKEDTVEQYWTQRYVQGPKMVDANVYVLTSNRTFSAAEEFTYNLKNMERGTIVGETTGGGAHPVEGHYFANLNVRMSVPFGRAINPISGTNWEGTGVAPDIECPADDALDIAYADALTSIRERLDEGEAFEVDWVLQGLEAKNNPPDVDVSSLSHYAGGYGPRTVSYEDGALHYQRAPNPPMTMIPMSETMFRFEEIDYFRLEIVLSDDGKPIALVGHYDNGMVDKSPRDGVQMSVETE